MDQKRPYLGMVGFEVDVTSNDVSTAPHRDGASCGLRLMEKRLFQKILCFLALLDKRNYFRTVD
jgi:hypothetical protein